MHTSNGWRRKMSLALAAAMVLGFAVSAADPPRDIYVAVHQTVNSDKNGDKVEELKSAGITAKKKLFGETPLKPGGLLVGLDVGVGKQGGKEIVSAIRPIYRNANGEKPTQDFGSFAYLDKKGVGVVRTESLKARPDYALGAITLRY